jgi:hypothetical protein
MREANGRWVMRGGFEEIEKRPAQPHVALGNQGFRMNINHAGDGKSGTLNFV